MKEQKLWKVYTHTTPDGMVYVGVTGQDIRKRWTPSHYQCTSLYPYMEKWGWKNIIHQVIYTTPDREEAYQVEDEMFWYYKEKGVLINQQRSGLVCAKDEKAYNHNLKKEKYANDPEYRKKHNEYNRQYYQNHPEYREKQKDYKRQWYQKKKLQKQIETGQLQFDLAL